MSRCWRCGRAVPEGYGSSYVYGIVCRRADCRRVDQLLSNRFKWFWFRASLPCPPDDHGRASSFTLDGRTNWPRGYGEPSLQTKSESDLMVGEGLA